MNTNDEKYSQRLSKRVHEGLNTMVMNGTYGGGHLLYGYRLIDTDKKGNKGTIHKVEIDEEQAEVVRFIFTEYAKGTDKKEIADLLNAQGKKLRASRLNLGLLKVGCPILSIRASLHTAKGFVTIHSRKSLTSRHLPMYKSGLHKTKY